MQTYVKGFNSHLFILINQFNVIMNKLIDFQKYCKFRDKSISKSLANIGINLLSRLVAVLRLVSLFYMSQQISKSD